MTQDYVIKMCNGQGHVEWYLSLGVRTQALSADEARRFPSKEAAEARAEEITQESMLSCFSTAFFIDGRWFIETTVEPLS